jgi:putative hydrolase of HD superfamily
MKMLLLHDLGEIYAGDTCAYDDAGKSDSYERELASLNKTLSTLPAEQAAEFLSVWKEFEAGVTAEARYGKIIDALIAPLGYLRTAPENYNPSGLTVERVLAKKAFIKDDAPELWQFTKKIIADSAKKGLYKYGNN